ncbi:MAG: NADH-quinone oxidoreductase subunit N, partial [Myxococcota bacterium]
HVLLSMIGILVVTFSGGLLVLFIGVEILGLSVALLSGLHRGARRSQEAAWKYFSYSAFASAFVLFGVALIYGEVGRVTGSASLAFDEIGYVFMGQTASLLGWIGAGFVVGGLSFKLAAVPFHMWAPDVFDGAPTRTTGFMAVAVKAAACAGLLRFISAALVSCDVRNETFVQAIELIAILTMVVGNLLAIRQTSVKRMLAYSSIAHTGYVFVGLAAFVANPESGATAAVGYYLLGYTAMTLGALGVVLVVERADPGYEGLDTERLAGLAMNHPVLSAAMAVFMVSLAGLPPTTGFLGKVAVFSAAIESGRWEVVLFAVFASVIGVYCYLRVVAVMFMREATNSLVTIRSWWLFGGLAVCAALSIGLGVMPEPALAFARLALEGWMTL